MERTLKDYKSIITPVWCPGCGDYGVLNALQRAFLNLEIAPENIIAVSGIGCSGRLTHYLNTYSVHGTHGRAVPIASGAKAARPDMTVIAVGGDGDGLGIGGGHISHAARKNVDITYVLIDNHIYGLTKGQTSPTTPLGLRTKTAPYGTYESTIDPIPMFLVYDVSFVALTVSVDVKQMTDIIEKAIQHKGMSMVYVLSPCKTFPIVESKGLKSFTTPIPDDHPRDDKMKALQLAYSKDPIYSGIFYQVQKPTLGEHLVEQIEEAKQDNGDHSYSLEQILSEYA